MDSGCRIAVIVPAYNEADKILATLRSVPAFVQHVIVVDDASEDGTGDLAENVRRAGLEVLRHASNRGVGAALATGYARAWALRADVTVVMAGDSQMDPRDLPALVNAVAHGGADYAKGNRFAWPGVWRVMPPVRLFGNVVLSWMTRAASGLWHVFDSQCGYTAASRKALAAIVGGSLFPRYGYPNDVLVRLSAAGCVVVDVPVRPVYGPAWRSGLRPWRVALPIAMLLVRGLTGRAFRRLRGRARPTPLLSGD